MSDKETRAAAAEASRGVTDPPADATERRAFLVGTVTAAALAGGLAVADGAAQTEAGQPKDGQPEPPEREAAGPGRLAGVVSVRFERRRPSLEDVQQAVAQIVRQHGCPACGLAGIQLELALAGNPVRGINVRTPANVTHLGPG